MWRLRAWAPSLSACISLFPLLLVWFPGLSLLCDRFLVLSACREAVLGVWPHIPAQASILTLSSLVLLQSEKVSGTLDCPGLDPLLRAPARRLGGDWPPPPPPESPGQSGGRGAACLRISREALPKNMGALGRQHSKGQ